MGTLAIDASVGSGISLDNLSGDQVEAHVIIDATMGPKLYTYDNYNDFLIGPDVTLRSRIGIGESTTTTLTVGPSLTWKTDFGSSGIVSAGGRAYGGGILGNRTQGVFGMGGSVGLGSNEIDSADWTLQLNGAYENFIGNNLNPKGSNSVLLGVTFNLCLY